MKKNQNSSQNGASLFHEVIKKFALIILVVAFAIIQNTTNAQFIQQGSKLVGRGAVGPAIQGQSVAISGDGNTAIVGGSGDSSNVGAVWVYIRSGGVWTQQGNKITGNDGIGLSGQGYSVSISSDGNTAIVGGFYDNSNKGAAWVYTRSGGVWTQQGSKLVGTGAVGNGQQGTSVSISSDGNTAIVGGPNDGVDNPGAIWIYTRTAGVWTQQGSKLVGTGAANGNYGALQGYSVSLSSDGNTAIAGGYGDSSSTGAVWIYTRSGGVWTQQGNKLVGTGAIGYQTLQGYSVSLSSDGNTAIVGGNGDNNSSGAVWIYKRSGGVWSQQGSKLVGTGTLSSSNQGCSVSISSDGNTVVEGGSLYNDGTSNVGAIWVFTRSSGVWTQQGSKLVGTGVVAASTQGRSVSLSSDGNTAFVGGTNDDGDAGAVWVYMRSGMVWTQLGNKLVGTGATGKANQGYSVAISSDGNTSIVSGSNDDNGVGAVWVYTRNGGVWSQQGIKLIGTGALSPASQGQSVSISGDGNTAVVGGPGDIGIGGGANGAVWIFTRSGGLWTQQGSKLVGTGYYTPANQGRAVSISSDGNTVIVGGVSDSINKGAVWIFIRSGGVWTQQGNKLKGTGDSIGQYGDWAAEGASVSLSADGNTAIVGGPGDNFRMGAVWIFTRSGGVWTQQGNKLVGTGASTNGDPHQGTSVSLSSDGNTAIVGGSTDNGGIGATWVFTRSGGVWTQQGSKLVGTGASGSAYQGNSVSLSGDGNRAIVGGFNDGNLGAAWVFIRSGGVWSQLGNKLVGTGSVQNSSNGGWAEQGNSVSLSSDGTTAIVGGYLDNNNAGAAWVYVYCKSPTVPILYSSSSVNCGTKATTLTVASGSLNGATHWQWHRDSSGGTSIDTGTSIIVSPTSSTSYYVGGEGGCVTNDTSTYINIKVNQLPIVGVSVSPSAKVCSGMTVILNGTGATSYTWSGGVTNGVRFIPLSNNAYIVTGTDSNGCKNTSTKLITVNNLPDASTHLTGLTITANQNGATYQWLDCGNNKSLISTAKNQSYSPTKNGSYAVVIYDSLGCSDTSACVILNNLGINQAIKVNNQLTIYPNPNTGMFTIQSIDEGVYSIINELGQTILQFELNTSNKFIANIENFERGIYFIVGYNNNEMSKQKIVITK